MWPIEIDATTVLTHTMLLLVALVVVCSFPRRPPANEKTKPYHDRETYKRVPWYHEEAGVSKSLKGKVALVTAHHI